MPEFSYELKIAKERVAVLIGVNGAVKKELEEITSSKINIDSKEGDIVLEGDDPINLFSLREVIRAIGRGFNPEISKLLLKQDYTLEIISLNNYSKEQSHQKRLKGRVIGMEGKARANIESLAECYISVYGKTISIIGTLESVNLAKRAIDSLLGGSPHSNVYKWLERQRKELKMKKVQEDFNI